MTEDEIRTLRFHLSWLPLFGAGLRIGYMETLDLEMDEAVDLLKRVLDERESEARNAFGGKGEGTWL